MNFLDTPTDKFEVQSISPAGLSAGDVIRFKYGSETKNAIVLVGNWNEKLHALSLLEGLSESNLSALLTLLSKQVGSDAISIRSTYESSVYTKPKPYRTYLPKKVSDIKVVKLAPKKSKRSER